MDEFKKITNVLKKIDSNAPHETFLILDATTGQSAINQVEEFKKISDVIVANRPSAELDNVSGKVYTRDLFGSD